MSAKSPAHELVSTDVPTVTAVRSTWLRASLATLESRGHLARYNALRAEALLPAMSDILLDAWLPVEVARTHYATCERLALSDVELFEIGQSITSSVHRSYFSFAVQMAKTAGATPWHVLESGLPRLWKRIWEGGTVKVVRTGPKDARVDLFGWPMSQFRYCRRSSRGVGHALCGIFAQKVYSHEVPQRSWETLSYTFYWV